MSERWDTLGPPPLALFALEQGRAVLEPAARRQRREQLAAAPRGDGHPVLVLPGLLRLAITLGTPLRDISASHAARLVGLRPGGAPPAAADELRARLREPLPVPATSIYSRTDGIVSWRSCVESPGPGRESIEVACSHTGLGFPRRSRDRRRTSRPAARGLAAAALSAGSPPAVPTG